METLILALVHAARRLRRYFQAHLIAVITNQPINQVLSRPEKSRSNGNCRRRRSVVAKAMQLGYYWPTMHMDSRMVIRVCQECQVHRPIPCLPKTKLTPITSSWPFHKWGMDICAPFPKAAGKCFMVDKVKNDEGFLLSLDLLEKKRKLVAITEEKHKRKIEKYYNSKVRNTVPKPGDLAYRSNEARKIEDIGKLGKLGPKWEDPYEVIKVGDGAYKLRNQQGAALPRT
ncbi:hypothetical protein Tco_0816883 [Tanacetum coccineum]